MSIRKSLGAAVIGATFLAVTGVSSASAMPPTRVIVRPYYRYYPYYAYGYSSPAWYGPAWYPRPYVYAPARVNTGEVKIETHMKGGSIYVDGGYAGETTKLKKFDLRPGNHDIEVRDAAGYTIYRNRIQVLVGKTTDIKLEA
jgi:hypothetical protein